MTNVNNTELNAENAAVIAADTNTETEVKTAPVAETQVPEVLEVVTSEATAFQAILNAKAQEKADNAVRAAGKLTATTWVSDMIVSRATDANYDLRRLPQEFSDVAFNLTRLQFSPIGILFGFQVAQNSATGVKVQKYTYVLTTEKYDTGRKNEAGHAVTAVRYVARQLGKLEADAALTATEGGTLTELRKLARKSEKGKLTGTDRAVLAAYEAKGVTNSLSKSRG